MKTAVSLILIELLENDLMTQEGSLDNDTLLTELETFNCNVVTLLSSDCLYSYVVAYENLGRQKILSSY